MSDDIDTLHTKLRLCTAVVREWENRLRLAEKRQAEVREALAKKLSADYIAANNIQAGDIVHGNNLTQYCHTRREASLVANSLTPRPKYIYWNLVTFELDAILADCNADETPIHHEHARELFRHE